MDSLLSEVANVVCEEGVVAELEANVGTAGRCRNVNVDVGFSTTVTVTVLSAYENGACPRRSENAKNAIVLMFAELSQVYVKRDE